MTLKNYIEIEGDFLSAVNIAFDLNNDKKIKGFIPTYGGLELIKDLMLSTHEHSTERARILVGAYGKGKSQMLLVFLALVFRKDPSLFENLLGSIKNFEPGLFDFIQDYINSEKKLLPIVIQGSYASLSQSFLSALQNALSFVALDDLMPETHFKAALNTIQRWEEEYPQTYEQFLKEIDEPLSEYKMRLGDYDVTAYEKFEGVYPNLTSGSQFNPFMGFDIVELYSRATEALCERGYSGIYVVYDEFSKYLESSITKASISDIKMLQDFAEKCNRSKEQQMHLILVSHKEIANYINLLPKQKVDGWKGVSERFKHVEIANHFSQIYDIISAVIKKSNQFYSDFQKSHREEFDELKSQFMNKEMFSELSEEHLETIIYQCYPLHPVTTFILPRLSELVAQNERTLFTFLSSNHKNTLSEFIRQEKSSFPLLTPDMLYDYFEPLLKKEPYTSEIRKIYNTSASILTQIDLNKLEAKLVKTLALIEIINQPVKLPAIVDVLASVYAGNLEDAQEVGRALVELQDQKFVIYVSRKTAHLKLKSPIGTDIRKRIMDLVEKNRNVYDVKTILTKIAIDQYLYPTAYNDDKEIVRYFDFSFLYDYEFLAVQDWSKKINEIKADGIVFGIILQKPENLEIVENAMGKLSEIDKRILFALPNEYQDINETAFEYNAILNIIEMSKEDEVLKVECDLYEEDLSEAINEFLLMYTKPELRKAQYFYRGVKKSFYRKAHLTQQLSKICNEIYKKTPMIKNEILNNNELTSVAIRSRNRVVSGLLTNKLQPKLALTGTGQEVSFMRSALIVTGILHNSDLIPSIQLHHLEDENLQGVINIINQFFLDSSNAKGMPFSDLYDELTNAENNIGLKRGVIPIYIACVLNQYKEHLTILSQGKELEITADLLSNINDNPSEYIACLEEWNSEKTQYIEDLEMLFSKYILETEKEFNTFSYIVRGMQRWFMSLPKYSRELNNIYQGDKKFAKVEKNDKKLIKSLMKPSLNSREYLFEKLLSIYGFEEFTFEVVKELEKTKDLFDQSKSRLVKKLMTDISSLFNLQTDLSSEASNVSVIKDWVDNLTNETKIHSFAGHFGNIFHVIQNVDYDETGFIEKLTKAAVGLRIDDWNDNNIQVFLKTMTEFKQLIESYDQSSDSNGAGQENDNYIFTVQKEDGEQQVKSFSRIETGGRAKMLRNEINTALEEMGQALSAEEKRQVLLDILESMI